MSSGPKMVGKYKFVKTLGAGSFGKVKKAIHVETKEVFAVKIIEKKRLNKSAKEKINREIKILKMLRHPFIVRLYETIDMPENIYLIMEYVVGGELFDYIVAHQRVKEKEAKKFFAQICLGVQYCHSNNIIHRDLKPENLMLDDSRSIKIIDFGLSNILEPHKFLQSKCGSPHYTAPEVTEKLTYGALADVFSLGVILFALLCGYLPFDDPNHEIIARDIKAENYDIPSHVSRGASSLIKAMIKADFKKRVSLNSVLRHPWLELDKVKVPEMLPDPLSIRPRSELPAAELDKSPSKGRFSGFSPLPKSLVAAISRVIKTDKGNDVEESRKQSEKKKNVPETAKQDRRPLAISVPQLHTTSPVPVTDPSRNSNNDPILSSSIPTLPKVGGPESPVASRFHVLHGNHGVDRISSVSTSNLEYPTTSAQAILMEKRLSIAGSGNSSPAHSKASPVRARPSLTGGSTQNLPVLSPQRQNSEASITVPYGRNRSSTYDNGNAALPKPKGRSVAAFQALQDGTRRQSMAYLPKREASEESMKRKPTPKSKRLSELKQEAGVHEEKGKDSSEKPVERRASMAVTEWAMAEKLINKTKQYDTPNAVNSRENDTTKNSSAGKVAGQNDENETAEYHPRGGAFNRSATSSKPPGEIVREMQRVLTDKGIAYKKKNDWRFKCKFYSNPKAEALGVNADLKFELEVFKLPRLPLHVVLYRRVQGGTWIHKDLCRSLLDELRL